MSNPSRRNLTTDVDQETRERAANVVELLGESGLTVHGHYFRRLPDGPADGRLSLFVQIEPRFRLPYGFIEDGTDLTRFEPLEDGGYRRATCAPTRGHLTMYADKLTTANRALEGFLRRKGHGLAELCKLLAQHGIVAEEFGHDNHNGLSLNFPAESGELLFLGAYPADIAEAIFVLVSHDDPHKGVEAVRRLR